jgi:hypothetical protein
MTLAARRAIPIHQSDGGFDQSFGQFLWIADGGGGQDELRIRSVEFCHALQPPDYIGEMRTEHAAVGVHLINYNESQIAEKVRPVGVMRQNSGMEHVGVGENDIGVFTDNRTMGLGRIAVVD